MPWKAEWQKARSFQKNLQALLNHEANNLDDHKSAIGLALHEEGRRRFGEFLDGVLAYRRHPYRRPSSPRKVLWREGTTSLLDYRSERRARAQSDQARVLVIPSLVNRYYILDFMEDCSFLRTLSHRGFDPYVIDWDAPGDEERCFTLTDYVARLERALRRLEKEPGGPILVVGYCMGGMLALALTLAVKDREENNKVAGLALLATPWDFHKADGTQAALFSALSEKLDPMLQMSGDFPVDLLQFFFAFPDPAGLLNKFRRFSFMDQGSEIAKRFVALEDWLNDGAPLSLPVARECLTRWYGANDPAAGRWKIDNQPILPQKFTIPTLTVVPMADRIVPVESALALADTLPHNETLRPKAGHIGMMAGRGAPKEVWDPLIEWMHKTADKAPIDNALA